MANANGANERTSVDDGLGGETRYWGARFCKTDRVTPWKLLWTNPRKGITQNTMTLRIVPGKDPTSPQDWDPYRTGPGRNDFGDWIRWHWAWRRGGHGDPITFLLHTGKDLDQQNPAQLLYRTVKYACDQNKGAQGHWPAMLNSNAGRSTVIPRPKQMWMTMGVVFEYGGKWFDIPRGLGEEDKIPLVDLGSDAAGQIVKFCRAKFKDEELAEMGIEFPTWQQTLKYGDPISLEEGRFFEIYPEATPPPHVLQAQRGNRPQAPTGPVTLSPSAMRDKSRRRDDDEEGGSGRDIQGYIVDCLAEAVADDGTVYDPRLIEFDDVLREKVPPWAEVLIFPDYVTQAKMIAPLLRLPDDSTPNGKLWLDVTEPAWGDHKDWHPRNTNPDLWAEWVGRVSVQGSDVHDARDARERPAAAGPALNRRPPPAAVEDETLRGRVPAAGPGQDDDDEAAPPPPRPRPGSRRPVAAPAAKPPATPPAEEPEEEDASDYFARIQREEEEERDRLKAASEPAPKPAPKPTPAKSPLSWQAKLAARSAANAAPWETPAAADDDDEAGGGFTAPPAAKPDGQPGGQLSAMRKAAAKIPPKS